MTILSKPIQTKKAMSDLANTESTRSSGRTNTGQRYLFMVVDKQRFFSMSVDVQRAFRCWFFFEWLLHCNVISRKIWQGTVNLLGGRNLIQCNKSFLTNPLLNQLNSIPLKLTKNLSK